MSVLIAEDDRASRTMLSSMLSKWGYEVIAVENGESAWDVLTQDNAPQLAILDWMMPAPDGVEICRGIRTLTFSNDNLDLLPSSNDQVRWRKYVYIILLTARSDKEDMIFGLEAGADDYIVKPFNADELQARLRAGARIVGLHNKLLTSRQQMEQLARTDDLTGILNRRAIIERLHQELARAEREGTPFSLVMLDLDHFKQVNDFFGHAIGDEVLKETVSRLQANIRAYDVLGRVGGEEFLVLLPGAEPVEAQEIATRIRLTIAEDPMHICSHSIQISISLGLTEWTQKSDLDTLMKNADDALYLAKQRGRNRIECI